MRGLSGIFAKLFGKRDTFSAGVVKLIRHQPVTAGGHYKQRKETDLPEREANTEESRTKGHRKNS